MPASHFPFEGNSRTRELWLWSMQSPGALPLAVWQDRGRFLTPCGVKEGLMVAGTPHDMAPAKQWLSFHPWGRGGVEQWNTRRVKHEVVRSRSF